MKKILKITNVLILKWHYEEIIKIENNNLFMKNPYKGP